MRTHGACADAAAVGCAMAWTGACLHAPPLRALDDFVRQMPTSRLEALLRLSRG